jgi:catechol 2,3-dioxygenase-like lactoylglutathione lyase family enzyme
MAEVDLGWLDVCLRVRDFAASQRFYEALGFRLVEGEPERGWGVFARESSRIGLFIEEYMAEDRFSLNFRGGCIPKVLEHLATQKIHPTAAPVLVGECAGSVKFRDPDGNLIFIDSAPDETIAR